VLEYRHAGFLAGRPDLLATVVRRTEHSRALARQWNSLAALQQPGSIAAAALEQGQQPRQGRSFSLLSIGGAATSVIGASSLSPSFTAIATAAVAQGDQSLVVESSGRGTPSLYTRSVSRAPTELCDVLSGSGNGDGGDDEGARVRLETSEIADAMLAEGGCAQSAFLERDAAHVALRAALAISEQQRYFETEALKAEINHLRQQNKLLQERSHALLASLSIFMGPENQASPSELSGVGVRPP
jgi:hypothetical protein